MLAMIKFVVLFLSLAFLASAAELPSKKYLNLAALKTMVAAVESEAQKRNVQVTICIDRKSTRLNSSHLGISYAVFCLKKTELSSLRPPGAVLRLPLLRTRTCNCPP